MVDLRPGHKINARLPMAGKNRPGRVKIDNLAGQSKKRKKEFFLLLPLHIKSTTAGQNLNK